MGRRFRRRTTSVLPTLLPRLVALSVGLLAACDVPNFEGPQIQEPPQGFLLVPDSYQPRRLFPERELVFHAAWVESLDDFSTIFIDGHPGEIGLEDVMAARDSVRRYAIDADTRFGEVEPLQVDGRTAWGWAERVETPSRGLVSVAYRAVVPYDTISYAIEVYSGEPAIKREAPDTLKAIVAQFAVGRTTYNLPLIAVMIGLALFVVSFVQSQRRAKAARLRSINLVKVEKKHPDASNRGTPATGTLAAPAGSADVPPPAPATPPPAPQPTTTSAYRKA